MAGMTTWQDRLVEEDRQLSIKVGALQSFMDSGKDFKMLSKEDQVLLELQFNYMVAYSHVLARRIDRFPKETT